MTQEFPSHSVGAFDGKVLKAIATLPANPNYDDPNEMTVSGKEFLRLYCQYTRQNGVAGSGFQLLVEYSPFILDAEAAAIGANVQAWYQEAVLQVNAVVAGADTTNTIQRSVLSYQATADGVETVQFLIRLEQNVERIRVSATDLVGANMGDLGILAEVF